MAVIERASPADRDAVERLIGAYIESEGLRPKPDRIAWAVDQVIKNRFPGVLLVAKDKAVVVGVALAVYSPSAGLGRVLAVNDFFVDPAHRKKGVGRALVARILQEAKALHVDRIDLEILPTNPDAAAFWRKMGFSNTGRAVFTKELS